MRMLACVMVVLVCALLVSSNQWSAAQAVRGGARNTEQKKEPAPKPVAIEDGEAELTPKNTTIQFVGTHVGPRPDPRTGYFTKFTGALVVDAATKAPSAATVEIETGSLITPIARLTGHLQSPDFFEVRRYPKATFQSKTIEAVDADRGTYKITGDLTIREEKKTISFPAKVRIDDAGVLLASQFKIKRSDFGMTFGPDRVVDDVEMTVTVGKPTPKVKAE